MAPPAGFEAIPMSYAELRLDTVLRCGQTFLWHVYPLSSSSSSSSAGLGPEGEGVKQEPREPEQEEAEEEPKFEYRLCLQDRLVCLRQSSSHLYYRAIFLPSPTSTSTSLPTPPSASPATSPAEEDEPHPSTLSLLSDYFQLPISLPPLYALWSSRDPLLQRLSLRPSLQGIRQLRQPPWDCLMSFICSQNNHISRITRMVHALPLHFSAPLVRAEHPTEEGRWVAYHPFPTPEALATEGVEQTLRQLGFGYRAKYIHQTARLVCSLDASCAPSTSASRQTTDPPKGARADYLHSLRLLPLAEARAALLALPGVGPKVADCVLLMALDQPSVIPVDTHVLQLASRHYGLRGWTKGKGVTGGVYEEVQRRMGEVWGERAGWAQGVVFAGELREFGEGKVEVEKVEKVEVGEVVVVKTEKEEVGVFGGLMSPASEGGGELARRTRRVTRPTSSRAQVKAELVTPTKERKPRLPPTPESLPPSTRAGRKRGYVETVVEGDEQEQSGRKVRVLEVGVEMEGSMSDRIKLRRRAVVRPP